MEYKIADARNRNMGLNNMTCKYPKYWCRLHQVWLSEKDVEHKKCNNKTDIYMIDTRRCLNLVENKYVKNVNNC